MKQPAKISPPAIGGSSLLVIFAVLCLTVFALLGLSTVLAEQRLSAAAVQSITDYYAADAQAEEIFARLRSGEVPDTVAVRGQTYRYTVAVSAHQTLHVELTRQGGTWTVDRWQTIATPEQIQETMAVWDGY